MTDRKKARRKAIIRRNLFLSACALVLVLIISLAVFIINAVIDKPEISHVEDSEVQSSTVSSQEIEVNNNQSDIVSSETESKVDSEIESEPESEPESVTQSEDESSASETASKKDKKLDANYERLLLVNGDNPLPDDYDYGAKLVTIDTKYINGSLRQVDKGVWPYMKAMIEAAWEDGVQLYIRSPYRSYDTQKMLYNNQVKREMDKGLDKKEAKIKAATVVAKPGTSEHHTGLAADFNVASDSFESTKMYKWLCKNGADYGFVMRYSEEKQPITGVIHESWHWRFVGIKHAKEMKKLDMCLEEYLEHIGVSN